ncbi:hypothetical protein [Amycolatopsis anabasis]|uniref:hypothetical protein n=1 Tax=Amycolatopsis anabasis TaxID=1840409 RepID=UPI00131C0C17|nr:hypothetical protein [Amycolatopsis anabasis]
MSKEPRHQVNIHGVSNAPIITGGTSSGAISGGTYYAAPEGREQALAELIELLERLRAEVADREPAGREVLEDNLADLVQDARNLGDPARAEEVEPAVVRSRWAKVKGLLTEVSQVSEVVAKTSESIGQIFT